MQSRENQQRALEAQFLALFDRYKSTPQKNYSPGFFKKLFGKDNTELVNKIAKIKTGSLTHVIKKLLVLWSNNKVEILNKSKDDNSTIRTIGLLLKWCVQAYRLFKTKRDDQIKLAQLL